jgi:hypothetical protein
MSGNGACRRLISHIHNAYALGLQDCRVVVSIQTRVRTLFKAETWSYALSVLTILRDIYIAIRHRTHSGFANSNVVIAISLV